MAAIVLLAATVAALLLGHRRLRPEWAVAGGLAAGAALRIVSWDDVDAGTDALLEPLAFLLLAVPLAAALDHAGFFRAAAARVEGGDHLLGALWIGAAGVTTLLNLDVAIVLLTPLYLRIAARHRLDPRTTALQTVLLASLASSALPVSNLTNLIVADSGHHDAAAFLVHLGPASLAATAVGWLGYRRSVRTTPRDLPVDERPPAVGRPTSPRDLRVATVVVGLVVVGFTAGDVVGVPAVVVAGAALAVLAVTTGYLPWRHVPLRTALVAGGLAVLATAAAPHLPLDDLLDRPGPSGQLGAVGAGVLGAVAVNNLPALVVALDDLAGDGTWAYLWGVNAGPVLWLSGSLAGLLWADVLRAAGTPVTYLDYARAGLRIGGPALVAGTAVLLLTLAAT